MSDVREPRQNSESREPREGRKEGAGRQLFKRRKICPFSEKNAPTIDYKDTKLLMRFVSERGRIIPRRISFVAASKQRKLAQAIKRARFLALMPYVAE